MRIKIAPLLLFLQAAYSYADFSGPVVRVIDGDTLAVMNGSQMQRVRLEGIDAPESKQAFGQRSKQELLRLTAHKTVSVITSSQDRYGRHLGTIFLDGININSVQVRTGMAWAYRFKGKAANPEYAALERVARANRAGLWSQQAPVEPWLWRRNNKH